ncbi:hypothetical protein BOTBODRAFT_338590 [Botryobasidium botryosum FD-172 SS1]|uniref:Uncharacterized protein n=1 Tax=Botryobasidium botryosum (strain FD-172 SS1) TaxID=930990 RepID=A0A067MIY7_BOTB1|nr:hypothetical protein BOTBODRAFT_338590 [Botryobasidium botryosum FD-172 SS1]
MIERMNSAAAEFHGKHLYRKMVPHGTLVLCSQQARSGKNLEQFLRSRYRPPYGIAVFVTIVLYLLPFISLLQ